LICVLVIPSLVSLLWMTAFGGTAIEQVMAGNAVLSEAGQPLKLFAMLEELPLAAISAPLAIALVVIFFVTSSDSGSLVIDTITAGGKTDAPVSQRVFWAVFEGLVAIVLLIAGGLGALQAAAVSTGIPFALVLLAMCASLWMGMRALRRVQQQPATADK
ncbi:MAG: BCCT family transporter, partial [Betaproteobacteria bacterium AqS2]|nr:BCCT family transporter [Betaproteobacteria bacterium AqS2]